MEMDQISEENENQIEDDEEQLPNIEDQVPAAADQQPAAADQQPAVEEEVTIVEAAADVNLEENMEQDSEADPGQQEAVEVQQLPTEAVDSAAVANDHIVEGQQPANQRSLAIFENRIEATNGANQSDSVPSTSGGSTTPVNRNLKSDDLIFKTPIATPASRLRG